MGVFMVYTEQMTQTQADLMKEAQQLLADLLHVNIVASREIARLPKLTKFFVIPHPSQELVRSIRSCADKPVIYTARCIIEARRYRDVKLPLRSLAVSLSMNDCGIFLVRSCNLAELKSKIYEMCGTVLGDFNDSRLNVVITDRADDKYCVKARARNVAVVTRDWVDETYAMSKSEDLHINHDALSNLSAYQIRPFEGLKFKITIPVLGRELRDLISNNGGKMVFGDNETTTHVVASRYPENESLTSHNDSTGKDSHSSARVIDVEFLKACDSCGYYMNKREYRAYRDASNLTRVVKQERFSPSPTGAMLHQNEEDFFERSYDGCLTPPQQNPRSTLSSIKSNDFTDRLNENQSMPPPPPSMPNRQQQQARQQNQGNNMDAILRKALTSFDNTAQTQVVSTQIRRLPETEIRFERPTESSQQLFWSDSITRRH